MYRFASETPDDWWDVEALYDLCFSPGREALSSYRLRDGVAPERKLSLVARDDDRILAGAIRYWPVRIGLHAGLLLGPIAVHPTRQGEGLGGLLIRESLRIATDLGWQRVMLIGDVPYYSRFGFDKIADVRMPQPTNPERVLATSLVPGAWKDVTGDVTAAADQVVVSAPRKSPRSA